jgi:hypothetical protein
MTTARWPGIQGSKAGVLSGFFTRCKTVAERCALIGAALGDGWQEMKA